MADEIIKRDQNHVTVSAAVTNNADLDVTMLRVDPVTNYLLIQNTNATPSSVDSSQIASRDQNYKPVCMGWDETNQTLEEIRTDVNGNLIVKFI